MIDQINLFTGGAYISTVPVKQPIALSSHSLPLVFYLIARKRKHERLVKKKQLDTQQSSLENFLIPLERDLYY